MPPTMFCRALLLSCKLAATPMVTPAARPIHGFVNVPVVAETNPVVNAHAPGSCSTGRGDDGSSAPMAALARARMRRTAVTLFMKDGSPVGIWCCCRCSLLGRIKTHEFGQSACCLVHLSKLWV